MISGETEEENKMYRDIHVFKITAKNLEGPIVLCPNPNMVEPFCQNEDCEEW